MRGLWLAVLAVWMAGTVLGAGRLPAAAEAAEGPEWQHALWTVGRLRADPPSDPVVLLLGGSAAREAIINDFEWAADVERLGGGPVAAYGLGSRLQTFEQDLALVEALPRIPIVVYIGINAGRFASPFTTTTDVTPPATKPVWVRHHYRSEKIWTPERKQERVDYWNEHRRPLFDERYPDHLADLDRLIGTCVGRGYTTVILALPRNVVAMDDTMGESVDRYLEDDRRLARTHGSEFVDFVPALRLANDDFFDLDHLVGSGREVYQELLALETVRLLGAARPGATSGSAASPGTAAGSASPWRIGGTRTLALLASACVLLGLVGASLRRRAVVRRQGRRRLAKPG